MWRGGRLSEERLKKVVDDKVRQPRVWQLQHQREKEVSQSGLWRAQKGESWNLVFCNSRWVFGHAVLRHLGLAGGQRGGRGRASPCTTAVFRYGRPPSPTPLPSAPLTSSDETRHLAGTYCRGPCEERVLRPQSARGRCVASQSPGSYRERKKKGGRPKPTKGFVTGPAVSAEVRIGNNPFAT